MLRRNQTIPGAETLWLDERPKPQSCSDLVWFDKRSEEEKARSLATHTHTHLAHGEQTRAERLSRLKSSPQKHSVTRTHTLLQCVLTEPTLSVWHTLPPLWTGSRRPPRLSPAKDHPQVMFKNREEWMDASVFHHFPPPYPRLYQWGANTNVLMFGLCAKIRPSYCDSWACWWNLIGLIQRSKLPLHPVMTVCNAIKAQVSDEWWIYNR